jgi:hypothetical protein
MTQKYNVNHPEVGQKSLPEKPCQKNTAPSPFQGIFHRNLNPLTIDSQWFYGDGKGRLLRTQSDCELFSLPSNGVAKFL